MKETANITKVLRPIASANRIWVSYSPLLLASYSYELWKTSTLITRPYNCTLGSLCTVPTEQIKKELKRMVSSSTPATSVTRWLIPRERWAPRHSPHSGKHTIIPQKAKVGTRKKQGNSNRALIPNPEPTQPVARSSIRKRTESKPPSKKESKSQWWKSYVFDALTDATPSCKGCHISTSKLKNQFFFF
jgi:hypothetical protein